jgi:hypothetical protein
MKPLIHLTQAARYNDFTCFGTIAGLKVTQLHLFEQTGGLIRFASTSRNFIEGVAVVQVLWLLGRKRFRQAMDVTMAGLYVRPETRAACSAAFLDHLLATEQYTGALSFTICMSLHSLREWQCILFFQSCPGRSQCREICL